MIVKNINHIFYEYLSFYNVFITQCINHIDNILFQLECSCSQKHYTMKQKFSNYVSIQTFFIIKCANIFDMRFIGRILHNFARFPYLHGLPRDVEESMQITCPAFHVHHMSSKFAFTDSYMYQNKYTGVQFEKFYDGTPPWLDVR